MLGFGRVAVGPETLKVATRGSALDRLGGKVRELDVELRGFGSWPGNPKWGDFICSGAAEKDAS